MAKLVMKTFYCKDMYLHVFLIKILPSKADLICVLVCMCYQNQCEKKSFQAVPCCILADLNDGYC